MNSILRTTKIPFSVSPTTGGAGGQAVNVQIPAASSSAIHRSIKIDMAASVQGSAGQSGSFYTNLIGPNYWQWNDTVQVNLGGVQRYIFRMDLLAVEPGGIQLDGTSALVMTSPTVIAIPIDARDAYQFQTLIGSLSGSSMSFQGLIQMTEELEDLL
jgi:hypothetical protein